MLANYLAAAVSAAAPLVAVPFYLEHLGPALWGMVSFALMLAVTLGILEIGISQRLVRDLAVLHDRDPVAGRDIFSAIEGFYAGAAMVVALTVSALAPWIAAHWLEVPADLYQDALHTVYFCAVLAATQILNSSYRSWLLASGRQVSLSVQVTLLSLFKHGGGIAVVVYGGGLDGLFLYLAGVSMADVITRRWLARWRQGLAEAQSSDWQQARTILIAGMRVSVAVIAGILALQLDRLYLSSMGTLEELGKYSIATALAYGVVQLVSPLIATAAPAMAVAARNEAQLDIWCRKLFLVIAPILALGGVAYYFGGDWLLQKWLRTADIEAVKNPLNLLLVGSALNFVYAVGYQRWISLGRTRIIMVVNFFALIAAAAITPLMIHRFDAPGAASAWISFNLIGLCFQAPWFLSLLFRRSTALGNTQH